MEDVHTSAMSAMLENNTKGIESYFYLGHPGTVQSLVQSMVARLAFSRPKITSLSFFYLMASKLLRI